MKSVAQQGLALMTGGAFLTEENIYATVEQLQTPGLGRDPQRHATPGYVSPTS